MIGRVIAEEVSRQAPLFRWARFCALALAIGIVGMLGLSGWFLASAALASASGLIAVQAFSTTAPAFLIRILAILRTGGRYGERLAGHAAALRASASIRGRLFNAILVLAPQRSLAITLGDASSQLTESVAAIEASLVRRTARGHLVAGIAAALLLGAVAGWKPLIGIALVFAVLLGAGRILADRLGRYAQLVQVEAADLRREVAMLVQAAPELRCYRLEAWALERIGRTGRRLEDAQRLASIVQGGMDGMLILAGAVAAAFSFLLAAGRGAPLAALAGFSGFAAVECAGPWLRDRVMGSAVARARRMLEPIFDKDREAARDAVAPAVRVATHAVGLPIDPRARTAITGPSGSGKSSLAECWLGLRGDVVPAIAIASPDEVRGQALHSVFAWCPQDMMIVAGSVRDNLRIGDALADDAAMWDALADAALGDRVATLGGLDYHVGENGLRLSGGERRRLALARAYLRPALCLLLDEPTEGLDSTTETEVVERLKARLDRTGQGMILISHRPAPLRLCERHIDLGAAPASAMAA